MAKVSYVVRVEVEITNTTPELVKVAGREILSGINTSVDQNQNVEDIEVTGLDAEVSLNVDCMPEDEINTLG